MSSFTALDLASISVFLCVVSIALATSMTLIWRSEGTRHGFGCWALAQWSFALGMLALLARPTLPEFLSILFGNAGVLTAMILLRAGIQRYRARTVQVAPDAILAGCTVIGLLVLYGFGVDIGWRIALATASAAVLALRGAVALVRPPPGLELAFAVTSWILVVAAGLALVRSVLAILDLGVPIQPFANGAGQSLIFLALATIAIMLPFALFLLNSLRNLDRLRMAQAEAQLAADTDYLTGLANRRRMFRELGALAPDARISISIIDIDDFKRVNDHHGHSIGDQVLARFGGLLLELCRRDDIPVRLGGEEFALLSPTGAWERHCLTAERLRTEVAKTLGRRAGIPEELTCSIGLAQGRAADIDAILGQADAALYEAKRAGKNRVVSDPRPADPDAPRTHPQQVAFRHNS